MKNLNRNCYTVFHALAIFQAILCDVLMFFTTHDVILKNIA